MDRLDFRLWWDVGVWKLLDPGEVIKSRSGIAPRQVGVTLSRQVRQVSKRVGPRAHEKQAWTGVPKDRTFLFLWRAWTSLTSRLVFFY